MSLVATPSTNDDAALSAPQRHLPVASWPLPAVLTVVGVVVAFIIHGDIAGNFGNFAYPLDDTYIDMAMAKTIVHFHVYGVTRYEIAPASSSILWPWLISAIYAVTGQNLYVPLVTNLIFAVVLLWTADRLLARYDCGRWTSAIRFAALLILTLTVPLPCICLIAMEHVAHALVVILLAGAVARAASRHATFITNRDYCTIGLLALVSTGIRYESFALLAASALLLAARGLLRLSAITFLAGCALPAIYAAVSAHYGQFPLPNSVIAKGVLYLQTTGVHLQLLQSIQESPVLAVLVLSVLGLLVAEWGRGARRSFETYFGCLFVTACVAHMVIEGLYSHYRYYAYLVAFGILAAAMLLLSAVDQTSSCNRSRKSVVTYGFAALLMTLASFYAQPIGPSIIWPIEASHNIFDQQVRNAFFLRRFYDHDTVLLNDVGAVCYYTEVRIFDDTGLASTPMLRAELDGDDMPRQFLRLLSQNHVQIGIVYDSWIPQERPSWIVARRTTENNVSLGSDSVSYVAFSPPMVKLLRAQVLSYFGSGPHPVPSKDLH